MDTTNTNNIAQHRIKDWDEVLLYDQLRRGPNTKNEQGDLNWEDSEWSQTLEKLYLYLKNNHSRRRLLRRLFVGKRYENPDCTEEEYLKYAENSSQKIVDYTQGNPDYWRKEKLKDVAQHLHGTLAKQNRPHKSMDELFKDYLNAGTPEEDPNDSEGYVVRDHHGDKVQFIKELFGESVNWPLDKILADSDPSEGRQFKSDDCVRLMTNNYLHRGFPKGIEGYVSGVVSNEYLGWEANYCHVMFIVGCEDETTVWEDFLEVQEDKLQLCNKKHPPSLWFPYQVARNGRVIRDQQSALFERHKESKPYTNQQLLDSLKEQPREVPQEVLQQEGKKRNIWKKIKRSNIWKKIGRRIL